MNKKSAFTVARDLPRKTVFVRRVQRYKCAISSKQFLGGERINNAQFWKEYVQGNQTYLQLSVQYKYSIMTIQGRIANIFSVSKSKKP